MSLPEIQNYSKSRSEWELLINEYIFNKRYRLILIDRLLDGMTYDELSEKYYVSSRQVKRIVADGLYELIKHI